ncbi:MAG: 4Fe-4S binding protein [Deltaproteobacteria bacterium]|nr:4Fe-4S binding protein [Deltaproteobacteria bacterium]
MGHIAVKDVYKKLGNRIDSLSTRVALNKTFYKILKELYTEQEADFICKMPYGFSSLKKIAGVSKFSETDVQKMLASLCSKGLVMDIMARGKFYYMLSPMVIGIFEFTMMRTDDKVDFKKMASLFHEYMLGDDQFFTKNFKAGDKAAFMRTLPHEEVIKDDPYVEVLSYEKAIDIIEQAKKISIGTCSCRHEKLHLGTKECDAPLDICTSFDKSADFLIRNNFAKEVSKSEMMEKLALSKEAGLVLNADNVQKGINYICHCCKCCCNLFGGINKYGIANIIMTSNFIAKTDADSCVGCGLCEKACPVNAISMIEDKNTGKKKDRRPKIDQSFCLGCGVCGLKCKTESIKLVPREQRVITPEDSLEKFILQCIERETLQYQLFSDPNKVTHKFARTFTGAFLRLSPVKKALVSGKLKSAFLNFVKKG